MRPILRGAQERAPQDDVCAPVPALCDFAVRLLWKAPCFRGASYALAARLPPELRLGARPGFSCSPVTASVISAVIEPNQSIHVRKAAKIRFIRLFQDPVPAADGIPDARRPAQA